MTETIPARPASDDILPESTLTPMQWVVLLICYFAYVLDGFDIVIIAYTAPAISAEWGIPAQELGLVFSASLLGMTLGAMFLASLADMYGRRLVVGAMLLVVGLATIGVVYSSTVLQLVVLRFVAGLGLGAIMAALAPLVGEYSPRRYRTLILAILVSGASMGPVVGGLMTAPVIESYGWQAVFLYAGALTVIAGILMFLVVPESMAFVIRRQPDGALAKVNRTLAYLGHERITHLPATSESSAQESASVKSLLTSSRWGATLKMWGAFFFAYAANYFLMSWLPQMLVQAGLSQSQGIQAVVVSSVGALIGTVAFGWVGRWWALNRVIAASFVVGAGTFIALGVLIQGLDPTDTGWIFWMVLFFTGFATSGAFANLYAVAMTIYPVQVRSTGIGWATGCGRSGAVVSPMVAGVLLGVGVSLTSLLNVFALAFVFAAVFVFLIAMRELP